jgi:ABC-type dipeptide/oligopeptide/nickel transport system permease component
MLSGIHKFVARRLIMIIPLFLVASMLLFSLLWLMPGDPAVILAGPQAGPEQVAKIRHEIKLDRPPYVVYFEWLGGVFHGDLGLSYRKGVSVSSMIGECLPRTIELGITALLFSIAIGIPLGIIAALRRRTKVDYATMGISLFGVSIPSFWLAMIAILIFGVWLGWTPALGGGIGPQYLILPAVVLGAAMTGTVSRLTRSSMLDVLNQDYIRTARAKGLRERSVIYTHALKNAFVPISTMLFMRLPHLFGGAIIIETIFQWPGMGNLMISAIRNTDFLVIQGVALMFVILVMIANLLADISYAYLNPRIRYGERK